MHGGGILREIEFAVSFDKLTFKWRVLGDATEVWRSDERAKILAFLTDADEPMAPGKIAVGTAMPRNNVDRLLGKMMKAGKSRKWGVGGTSTPTELTFRIATLPPVRRVRR